MSGTPLPIMVQVPQALLWSHDGSHLHTGVAWCGVAWRRMGVGRCDSSHQDYSFTDQQENSVPGAPSW